MNYSRFYVPDETLATQVRIVLLTSPYTFSELLPTEVFDTKKYSDPTFREYLETVGEQKQLEWDDVGSDFEIVSFDIPTYCSTNANDEAFTCNK